MSVEWYFSRGETLAGPVSLGELERLVASGQVRPTGTVWRRRPLGAGYLPLPVEARRALAAADRSVPARGSAAGPLLLFGVVLFACLLGFGHR